MESCCIKVMAIKRQALFSKNCSGPKEGRIFRIATGAYFFLYVYLFYYIPIIDTTLELSFFWPSDTESRINELRFSESILLSYKTRLTSVTCFCGVVA